MTTMEHENLPWRYDETVETLDADTLAHTPLQEYSLETAPLSTEPVPTEVDPAKLILDVGRAWQLFLDVRRSAEGYTDGFIPANAVPLDGKTFDELGSEWEVAKAAGEDPRAFFDAHTDRSHATLPVRDAHPQEHIGTYMDYMADDALQLDTRHPFYIPLPHPTDAPGTRFIGAFPADNDVVAIGKIFRGDVDGGRRTIDNGVYLINRLCGLLPNWNGHIALDRSQSPTISYAVERLAAAYGEDGDEVVAHYRKPLAKHLAFWMRGREHLDSVRHDQGAAHGRQILLPGREHDIVFRFNSDAPINHDTMQGLRVESLLEDYELAERVLHGLSGEERRQRFDKLMRDVLAACESTQDFAPDWQSADYKTMEQIRTTDIAPVFLQANMIHLMRMTGRTEEANKLAHVLNRRFWRDIDATHGQYVDLTRDGSPTEALHAAQVYPLLVGGIVPYDRAVKVANTWRDVLLRRYGVLISAGSTKQQWSGNPSPTGDTKNDELLRRVQHNMYGRIPEEDNEDRTWPSVNMWVAEAFTLAAIEAKAKGHDPEPLLEVAELVRVGIVEGIETSYEELRYVGEKLSATDPAKFVNGGEYGKTRETAQRGFGMTIGAYRSLSGRNLRGEVAYPLEYSWRQYTLRHSLGGLLVPKSIDGNPTIL